MTIQNFKDQGYKVYVSHFRYSRTTGHLNNLTVFRKNKTSFDIATNGGVTTMEIVKGEKSIRTQAICNLNDNFNKRVGVAICTGRLQKELNELNTVNTVVN